MSNESKADAVTSGNTSNSNKGIRRDNRKQKYRSFNKDKFKGAIPELEGKIYDCAPGTPAQQFAKTTEALADYFVSNNTGAGLFRNGILTCTV